MAVRTNATDVKVICETNLTDAQVDAFITAASLLVDDLLVDQGLGATLLTEIEKYLAAHFLSLRDQRAAAEKFGSEYQVTYQGKTGMGLAATTYGQTAMTLDTSGTLQKNQQAPRIARLVSYGEDDD